VTLVSYKHVNSSNFNFDYKKNIDYHKRTEIRTCFGIYYMKKRFHLPHQFNKKYYDQIEAFQKENTFIVPLHVRDMIVKGDTVYKPPM